MIIETSGTASTIASAVEAEKKNIIPYNTCKCC